MQSTRQRATALLGSKYFFRRFLRDIGNAGLVGETVNALVLYIVAVSRLCSRPLSVLVKGKSSSGKNFLARTVLKFFPKDCVHEISSLSDRALNYLEEHELEHAILYIQEQGEQGRSARPNRLLLSEGKLIHWVVKPGPSGMETKHQVTAGPVACISTTTADRLEIDDESRNVSVWLDDSSEQTKRIARAYDSEDRPNLDEDRLKVWRQVQRLLEERSKVQIIKPEWFSLLVDELPAHDVRVRRYFPAFVEACKTVCLIRSFRLKSEEDIRGEKKLFISFADFAITALIFDRVFAESLTRGEGQDAATRESVLRVSEQNSGKPIQARDLAQDLGISGDKAYRLLRQAVEAGTVLRANRPAKANRKLYLPSLQPRFIPEPRKVFQDLKIGLRQVSFVHPTTGEDVTYERRTT